MRRQASTLKSPKNLQYFLPEGLTPLRLYVILASEGVICMNLKTEKDRIRKIGTVIGTKLCDALAKGLVQCASIITQSVGESLVDASQQMLPKQSTDATRPVTILPRFEEANSTHQNTHVTKTTVVRN